MYEKQEKIFYYITLYNENYPQPAMPEGVEEGILKGMYRFAKSTIGIQKNKKAHVMASGSIMMQAFEAQKMLEEMGISTDIWSVTSYNELLRDGYETDRWNMLHPDQKRKTCYLQELLKDEIGVFVSVSDYQKSLAGGISRWMPASYKILGTDGYGLSEGRTELRNYFEINARFIVLQVLNSLAENGSVKATEVISIMKAFCIDPEKQNPAIL
jgi:pyruvate dehydrogenase E1 component